MGLHPPSHSAPPQPAAEEEEAEEQEEDREVPTARPEVWLFHSGFTTWLPVTLTSPTTSCGAMNTGRRLTDWPLTAKVGQWPTNSFAWLFASSDQFLKHCYWWNSFCCGVSSSLEICLWIFTSVASYIHFCLRYPLLTLSANSLIANNNQIATCPCWINQHRPAHNVCSVCLCNPKTPEHLKLISQFSCHAVRATK